MDVEPVLGILDCETQLENVTSEAFHTLNPSRPMEPPQQPDRWMRET